MAQFAIDFSDEVDKLFSQLGDRLDEVAPKMLEAAAPILRDAAKAKAVRSGKNHKHMADNITISKPKKAKNGAWISTITIKGKRAEDNVRLMEVAAVNEYGSSKMSPQPFLRPAIAQSEAQINSVMLEIFEREMSK